MNTLALAALVPLVCTAAPADPRLGADAGWPTLSLKGRSLVIRAEGPAVDVRVDDRWLLSEGNTAPVARTAGGGIEVAYETPAGVLTDRISPFPGFPRCFSRRISFVNRSGKRCDVEGARLHLGFPRSKDARTWQCQSFAMVEVAGDPAPPKPPTVGGVRGGRTPVTLCAAFTSDEEFYDTSLGADGRVTHHPRSCWRLEPGQEAVVGTQYFWTVPGDLEKARASAQAWYDAVGLTVAEDGPSWLGDQVLYQACAGGSVDSRFSDTGGFAAFSRQLDLIADMGFNAFWLMSVLQHKDPASPATGWNLYDPADYSRVDPAYGGDEGLTALVKGMRARGFRILSEIVPHGGHAPQATGQPESWTYNRKGERSLGFGQGMDYSSPAWQETIRATIARLAQTWGFDGWRVDVADGYGVNWRPERVPHVSRSTMGGSLGMLKAIREGHLRSGRPPVITPESHINRPEHARYGQLGYGFDLVFFLDRIRPASLAPAELRRELMEFFERERGSLPRGMLSLRGLNNHDAVVFWGRADHRFGVGLQRALTAVCAVVPGVPMVYQEQEVGSYDYFRRLFWARRRVPEICRGEVDYLGVQAPPEVFAVLRSLHGAGHAVGLVNLSPSGLEGEFTLPKGIVPGAGATLYDAVSGKSVRTSGDAFTWRLEPYGVALLRVGRRPEGAVPAERHRSESVAPTADLPSGASGGHDLRWHVGPGPVLAFRAAGIAGRLDPGGCAARCEPLLDGGVRVVLEAPSSDGTPAPRLEILGVDRWYARTEAGVYEDRILRRHYPWPEGLYSWNPRIVWGYEPHHLYRACLPAGRQWQSAVAPLAPGEAALGFADASGRGFALSDVETNAANTILTDRSEEPDPMPYGLTLRFAAEDADLNPNWVPGYRDSGWAEVPNPRHTRAAGPLRVSFVLRPMGSFAPDTSGLAPGPRPGRLQVGPGRHHSMGERIWLVEPNEVAWVDVPVSATATWDLWLQLRHSERSGADRDLCAHYRVTLDGRPVDLEWVKLNVWSTGNGYFGWARVRGVPLEAGAHTLRIATTHTWCALLPKAYVSRDANWQPK